MTARTTTTRVLTTLIALAALAACAPELLPKEDAVAALKRGLTDEERVQFAIFARSDAKKGTFGDVWRIDMTYDFPWRRYKAALARAEAQVAAEAAAAAVAPNRTDLVAIQTSMSNRSNFVGSVFWLPKDVAITTEAAPYTGEELAKLGPTEVEIDRLLASAQKPPMDGRYMWLPTHSLPAKSSQPANSSKVAANSSQNAAKGAGMEAWSAATQVSQQYDKPEAMPMPLAWYWIDTTTRMVPSANVTTAESAVVVLTDGKAMSPETTYFSGLSSSTYAWAEPTLNSVQCAWNAATSTLGSAKMMRSTTPKCLESILLHHNVSVEGFASASLARDKVILVAEIAPDGDVVFSTQFAVLLRDGLRARPTKTCEGRLVGRGTADWANVTRAAQNMRSFHRCLQELEVSYEIVSTYDKDGRRLSLAAPYKPAAAMLG